MIELSYEQKINIGFQYVLDILAPCSPYGAEKIRKLKPFTPAEKQVLEQELYNLERVYSMDAEYAGEINSLMAVFMRTKNITKIMEKCLEAPLGEVELFEIKRYLLHLTEIVPMWEELNKKLRLSDIVMNNTDAALDILDPEKSRVPSFYVSDSYSQSLRSLRREKTKIEEEIRRCADKTKKTELLAERSKIAASEEQEEKTIRALLSEKIRPYIPDMLINADAIGSIDLLVQKAQLAHKYGGVMPSLSENEVEFDGVISPQISDVLAQQGKSFTPVSIELKQGSTVITGANMGGKSVALKAIALNVLLCHCGFFAFAKKAVLPMFEALHLVSEDMQSIDRGLSSFGAEIVQLEEVVSGSRNTFSLNILDEFARGTNPDEGAVIVRAVTEYFNKKPSITLLTTHYDNVAGAADAHYQVIGLKDLDVVGLKSEIAATGGEGGIALISRHMNYGLYKVEGKQNCPRDALNICRMLALDDEILDIIEKSY